jgi:hypothetical protein
MNPTGQPADSAIVARRFLAGLQAMDIEAALSNFSPDAVQEMPFAPPVHRAGKESSR